MTPEEKDRWVQLYLSLPKLAPINAQSVFDKATKLEMDRITTSISLSADGATVQRLRHGREREIFLSMSCWDSRVSNRASDDPDPWGSGALMSPPDYVEVVTIETDKPCDHCGGDGGVECGDCGGDGQRGDPRQTGNRPCRSCDGTGRQECPECDGTKGITYGSAVFVVKTADDYFIVEVVEYTHTSDGSSGKIYSSKEIVVCDQVAGVVSFIEETDLFENEFDYQEG
jgi:hypothetical protein